MQDILTLEWSGIKWEASFGKPSVRQKKYSITNIKRIMAEASKSIILSILLASSIVIRCFGQKKTDWQISNLKGRVKSLITTEYNATEKFGEPVKIGLKEKSEISKIQFDSKGIIVPLNKRKNTVSKFDKKGNKIEEIIYGEDSSSIISKGVFKYDANGNVIESVEYNSQGDQAKKNLYIYDLNGNLLMCKSSGNLFNGTRNQGQELIFKNKYDGFGRLMEFTVKIGDSELSTSKLKYDAKGNTIETTSKVFNGISKRETYKYNYDESGNWITKICFSSADYMNMSSKSKANIIVERQIEYHKEPAQIEKEYRELLARAEYYFAFKTYSQAMIYYQQSLEIKNEQAIKDKILLTQKLQLEQKYQNYISYADSAFNEKKYTTALSEYQKAFDVKDEQYPKDKLKETQEKIDEEQRQKEAELKSIAEQKARKEKFEVALKRGNIFNETKKYKEALAEYNSANAIELSIDVYAKIKDVQNEIDRIDSLQKLRLETYSSLKRRNLAINFEMNNLKVLLDEKKKIYGKNYEISMNFLNSKFPTYFTKLSVLFAANKTNGLTIEDNWNESDQVALELLTQFNTEFKSLERFHNAVKTAFESKKKDQLKLLKSSEDPKEIIAKF